MRLIVAALLVAAMPAAAIAQNDLPPRVESNFRCGHVYALRSEELRAAGDEAGALEFFHMGDALLWEARDTLEKAGYASERIDGIDASFAMTTGFSYGAGEGEQMLAGCLAEWDSP